MLQTLLQEFLDFFAQCHANTAEDLAQGFKEGIAEGLDAKGVDAAHALRLNQAALDAGHHSPDVAEGDAGKQEAPEQGHGDTKDSRQNAVAPVFGNSESGVAELPHPIQAVCTIRLCNDILKLHLIRHFKKPFINTDTQENNAFRASVTHMAMTCLIISNHMPQKAAVLAHAEKITVCSTLCLSNREKLRSVFNAAS